jgi:hypothetical protein
MEEEFHPLEMGVRRWKFGGERLGRGRWEIGYRRWGGTTVEGWRNV